MSGKVCETSQQQAREMVETVARAGYGKLVAYLAAPTRDVASAEDAVSEAFAAALVDWPANGCPRNPEGWLLTVAKRKMIDGFRRTNWQQPASDLLERIGKTTELLAGDQIPDVRLAMLFACAHPAIDAAVHAPLMMQSVLGLNAERIASAFLVSPAAMGKRLVRAKEKIRQAAIPIRVPDRAELPDRLDAVLNAIYAAFSEGWADPGGSDAARRDLSEEALFLARIVAELLPQEPEALGLMALLLFADSRRGARRNQSGKYVPFAKQDRSVWDYKQISEAESLLHRASELGRIGRFQLEAALQSAHVDRSQTGISNWPHVVELYDALYRMSRSPVVLVNRALAISERDGAQAGLDALPELKIEARLTEYQPYWATRAELLARCGAFSAAREAIDIAIGLERDEAVRQFLQARRAEWPL
jgi:RNA polymerase sigma-70 factor (ECF subfamily)